MVDCLNCGKKLSNPRHTHCSEKCIFEEVSNGKSVAEFPVKFDMDADPWI